MKKLLLLLFFMLFCMGQTYGLDQEPKGLDTNTKIWRQVQKRAKDTVVQLFVQTASFNWLQPFKSPKISKAYGTGFFIDAQGYLISNFHVVDERSSVKIQIPSFGKKRFDVEVVGVCPQRDLALLKLTDQAREEIIEEFGRIPFLELGDSDSVVRTQKIMALGYPLGQQKLKSAQGIVSGREHMSGESYIQITAALNAGNSGGPSLDQAGKVIGINTSSMDQAQNIGYIIPINDVKSVLEDLRKTPLLYKPLLGCKFNYGTTDLVSFLGNPQPGGFYIARVFKNTLFERAGIKAGDMLYSINGNTLDMYGEMNVAWSEDKVPLAALLNRFEVGQPIELEFYRRGEKFARSVNFDLLDQLPIRLFYPDHEIIDFEIIGGMVVMQLTLNHIYQLGRNHLLKFKKRQNQYEPQLLITHLLPNSQAKKARVLQRGDRLTHINGVRVKTLKLFREKFRESDQFITLRTWDKRFVVLDLKKIMTDEPRLSDKYFYDKTALFMTLYKRFSFQDE